MPDDLIGNVEDTSLRHALSQRYLAYALSTITSRSLPDLRDGLKSGRTAPRLSHERVTAQVRAKQPRALALVLTRGGEVAHRSAAGEWWRLYDFVEGAHTVERVTTEAQAREIATYREKLARDKRAAAGAADTIRIGEVENRLLAGRESNSLIARVEEAAAPEAGVERLVGRLLGD